jgi:hypothetical protein
MKEMHGGAPLLEVVQALTAAGRFSRRLDRRQQQGHQDADNRDHHEQFDQRETAPGVIHSIASAVG